MSQDFHMNPACWAELEKAKREGRHSDTPKVVCPECRQEVSGFWSKTQDGRYLCRECSPPEPKPLTQADLDRMRARGV